MDWGDVGAEIIEEDAYSRGEITPETTLKGGVEEGGRGKREIQRRGHAPDAGDIAWVELDPEGREQAGRRPALVITRRIYHEQSKRALICPITSRVRAWPFHMPSHASLGMKTTGVVLADQVRAIDRSQRLFDIIERAPGEVLAEVRDKIAALIGIDVEAIGRA